MLIIWFKIIMGLFVFLGFQCRDLNFITFCISKCNGVISVQIRVFSDLKNANCALCFFFPFSYFQYLLLFFACLFLLHIIIVGNAAPAVKEKKEQIGKNQN